MTTPPDFPGSMTLTLNGATITIVMESFKGEVLGGDSRAFANVTMEFKAAMDDVQTLMDALKATPPPPREVGSNPPFLHPADCGCESCLDELEDGDR